MIFQYLGKILLFISITTIIACSESNKKLVFNPEKPVEITLVKQYWNLVNLPNGSSFYDWMAEVNINNKSEGIIMINKYTKSEILNSRIILYNMYGDTIKVKRWYATGFNEFDTLAPNMMKTYLLNIPFVKRITHPDVYYLNFGVYFITNYDGGSLPAFKKEFLGDTLEKKASYGLNFNYMIDQNGTRIRPIEEHVDSIFKNSKVDVDPDFY